MTLHVGLESEKCTEISDLVPDDNGLFYRMSALTRGLDRFELLKYVDLYGRTVFNGSQMPVVERELRQLMSEVSSRSDRDFLERAAALAVRGASSPHQYLVFIGD